MSKYLHLAQKFVTIHYCPFSLWGKLKFYIQSEANERKEEEQEEQQPKKKRAEEPRCDEQAPKPNEGTGTSSGGELPDLTPEKDGAVPSTSTGTSNQI